MSALAERAARAVADALDGPAVVVGSIPPEGRDLDVVLAGTAAARLRRTLMGRGFIASASGELALFADCSGYAVELLDLEEFLPVGPRDRLITQARPLPGLAPLSAPCGAHALLILARQVFGRPLPEKRRRRLERILATDPAAWEGARAEAAAWGAEAALSWLQRAADGTLPAVTGHARGRRWRSIPKRLARSQTVLVSLSGLDGSGKSSQTRWLNDTLAAVGVEAEVVWNNLSGNRAMTAVGRPLRAALALGGLDVEPMAEDRRAELAGVVAPRPTQTSGLRRGWGDYATLTEALTQRTRLARSRLRHRVVIFDRGPLDLAVRMEVLYPGAAEQLRLVELASPQPDLAFLLEISAEVSRERKDDRWSLEQLRHHAELYQRLAGRFGVRRLDGGRPRDELAAEIAGAVWRRLA